MTKVNKEGIAIFQPIRDLGTGRFLTPGYQANWS
jgi:hypothetical protein